MRIIVLACHFCEPRPSSFPAAHFTPIHRAHPNVQILDSFRSIPMEEDDEFDLLLRLAEAEEDETATDPALPSLLIKDDEKRLEEAYGRDNLRQHLCGQQFEAPIAVQPPTMAEAFAHIPAACSTDVPSPPWKRSLQQNQGMVRPILASSGNSSSAGATAPSRAAGGARSSSQTQGGVPCYKEALSGLRVGYSAVSESNFRVRV